VPGISLDQNRNLNDQQKKACNEKEINFWGYASHVVPNSSAKSSLHGSIF